jgi:dTDP-glucose 4,6-dehydratase
MNHADGLTVLVTGAAGFIGSNFIYRYLDQHPDRMIIGVDKLTYAGNLENLGALTPDQRERFTFVRGDITDSRRMQELFSQYRPDRVINFAAESHVDRSISDPQVFLRTNILGTCTLLDTMVSCWKGREDTRFVQVSTDEVYGSLGPEEYFTEETPLDPHSPYSASKASADLIASAYHDTYGIPVLITRCSNNYGPWQFPEKLIPLMIRNALAHLPLPVYGDGTQVRDWLYVDDHCAAIDAVLDQGRPGERYNIGGSNEWKNIDLIRLIITILQEETGDERINADLIRFVRDRPGHDRRYAVNAQKIKAELGWRPQIRFSDGILMTIRWYMEHQGWMHRVISGEYMHFYEENYQDRI